MHTITTHGRRLRRRSAPSNRERERETPNEGGEKEKCRRRVVALLGVGLMKSLVSMGQGRSQIDF